MKEKEYKVESEKLKEHFPLEVVTQNMLKLFENLLGLKIIKLKDAQVKFLTLLLENQRKILIGVA